MFSPEQDEHLIALYERLSKDLDLTIDVTLQMQDPEDLGIPFDYHSILGLRAAVWELHIVIKSGDRSTHPILRDLLADFKIGWAPDSFDFMVNLEEAIRAKPPLGRPFDIDRGVLWQHMAWSSTKNMSQL